MIWEVIIIYLQPSFIFNMRRMRLGREFLKRILEISGNEFFWLKNPLGHQLDVVKGDGNSDQKPQVHGDSDTKEEEKTEVLSEN